MSGLRHRSTQPELMDTESASFAEFHDCLQNLSIINRCTLAYRPTLQWLERAMAGIAAEQPVCVMDIGCGGGDMLRQIWKRVPRRNLTLIGIDRNPWSTRSAEQVTPRDAPIRYETANLFSLGPSRHADFIVSSLFAHHLTDSELLRFIRWMDRHATRGWFINDLHRHWLPFYFIKYAVRLRFSNRLIRHDAPLSVARAFAASDWQLLLQQAGIPEERSRVEWFFPFRFGVTCKGASCRAG